MTITQANHIVCLSAQVWVVLSGWLTVDGPPVGACSGTMHPHSLALPDAAAQNVAALPLRCVARRHTDTGIATQVLPGDTPAEVLRLRWVLPGDTPQEELHFRWVLPGDTPAEALRLRWVLPGDTPAEALRVLAALHQLVASLPQDTHTRLIELERMSG